MEPINIVDFRSFTLVDPKQKIITRDVSQAKTIQRIVFHCTDASGWSPDKLSHFFVEEKGYPICGYHYYVTGQAVYHMVGENILTYHAAPFNKSSVAFSIDYHASHDEPLHIAIDPAVMKNAYAMATHLCLKFKVPPSMLVGHRELPMTGFFMKQDHKVLRKICPGMAIDLDIFRFEVTKYMQEALNVVQDGVFGPKTLQALSSYQVWVE